MTKSRSRLEAELEAERGEQAEHARQPTQPPSPSWGCFVLKPGTLVTVKDCPNGYPLPPGLQPGERVRILEFDHGYYWVDRNAERLLIFMANVAENQPRIR
jgi:hypothetical protein